MTDPAAKRRWKNRRATSLQHAMELCVQYAKDVHNLSVERIAERMALTSHWRIYKWMSECSMPIRYVQAFEHACGGCDFITQYLASAGHKLVVDIPTGRKATETEVSEMQALCSEATAAIVRFYRDEFTAADTVLAIENAISSLAYHREQVGKNEQPELDLFGGDTDERS